MGQALRAHKGLGRTENPLCNLYCEEKVEYRTSFACVDHGVDGQAKSAQASGRPAVTPVREASAPFVGRQRLVCAKERH